MATARPETLVPPPGVSLELCKNYPYCDNEVLARHTAEGAAKGSFVFPGPDADVILPRVNKYVIY